MYNTYILVYKIGKCNYSNFHHLFSIFNRTTIVADAVVYYENGDVAALAFL